MVEITVYTVLGCLQCNATVRALDLAQLDYVTVEVSEDHEAVKAHHATWLYASVRPGNTNAVTI